MTDITCPYCNIEFEASEWDSGNCPKCKKEYWWYGECAEDFSDCWMMIEWEQ